MTGTLQIITYVYVIIYVYERKIYIYIYCLSKDKSAGNVRPLLYFAGVKIMCSLFVCVSQYERGGVDSLSIV